MNLPPIPVLMGRRPLHGGVAIPWITAMNPVTRLPVFSGNNEALRVQAIHESLCSQCGNPLDRLMVFIGDGPTITSRFFVEPATHRACADYAAKVCPYLRDPTYQLPEHARVESVPGVQMAPWVVRSLPALSPEAGGGVSFYVTNGYRAALDSDGLIRAFANPPLRLIPLHKKRATIPESNLDPKRA